MFAGWFPTPFGTWRKGRERGRRQVTEALVPQPNVLQGIYSLGFSGPGSSDRQGGRVSKLWPIRRYIMSTSFVYQGFMALSLRARPVERFRGRTSTLCLKIVQFCTVSVPCHIRCSGFYSVLNRIVKTECAQIHHNCHHLLTTPTDQTKNRKCPIHPTSLPTCPVFPRTHKHNQGLERSPSKSNQKIFTIK